jgi:predicted nucleotidyltransferase
MATLSKHDLDVGLRRLGALAVTRGIEIELVVIGGAAMVLGFEARAATKDVDVVIRAPAAAIVRQLAADLAEELGWSNDESCGGLRTARARADCMVRFSGSLGGNPWFGLRTSREPRSPTRR